MRHRRRATDRLTNRDDDIVITPVLRLYLAAFDGHLRAIARDDHRRASITRALMTGLLHGVRTER